MNNVLLSVDGLSVAFRDERVFRPVTHGVTFQVRRGEVLGLVGESGSGKSVTAKVIMGLLPKNTSRVVAGSALFDGRNVIGLSEKEYCALRGNRIAMIFQEPMTSLNPVFTCGNQLMEAIMLHQSMGREKAWEKAADMMDQVGIPMPRLRMRNYPHEMSGGMRQRVMIAMALCCNPDLLIADEPTTALDPTIQAQILELIRDLQKQRDMAVLYISHDLGVIAETCQRVVVLYAGSVMECAPVRELFRNPRHPYTQGLIASIPRVCGPNERLTSIEGSVPHFTDMPAGCPFHPRCAYASARCREEMPPLTHTGEHQVRCFHAQAEEGGA